MQLAYWEDRGRRAGGSMHMPMGMHIIRLREITLALIAALLSSF